MLLPRGARHALQAALLFGALSAAFSVWFVAAAALQPVLSKYLPIGVVFLAVLAASFLALLPAVHCHKKA